MIKVIILDLDLTLVDTLERFYIVYNKTREKFGLRKLSKNEFLKYFEEDMLDPLLPENVNRREFWRSFRTLYGNIFTKNDKPIDGALNVLQWLKNRGFKVIITTGREVEPGKIWKELKTFSMDKYVDEVYTIKQQDPEEEDLLFSRKGIIKHILKKHKIKPKEAVFVGDYWVDMEAGKATQVITVGVLTGRKKEKTMLEHGAQIIINGIWELPRVLKELCSKSNSSNKNNGEEKPEEQEE